MCAKVGGLGYIVLLLKGIRHNIIMSRLETANRIQAVLLVIRTRLILSITESFDMWCIKCLLDLGAFVSYCLDFFSSLQ